MSPEEAVSAEAAARAVDGPALLARLRSLGRIGRTTDGGVSRTSFSPEFVAGRDLVARACGAAGHAMRVDAVGNLVCLPPGEGPAILVGSHLDTVENGGLLDGAYGVLAGLSAIEAIARAGVALRHRLVLVGFANEEGADGTPALLGSKACAGRLVAEDLRATDRSGRAVEELVKRIGGRPESFQAAELVTSLPVAAYVELHVEQGPVLEQAGIDLGVVTAITGRTLVDVRCTGRARHAGTTPMAARADALVAAARVVDAIDRLARGGAVRVATAGALRVVPGARNTVPGEVEIEAELRADDASAMADGVEALRCAVGRISEETGVGVELRVLDVVPPCPTDRVVREAIAEGAAAAGASTCELASGAGHDAQSFWEVVPMGMCFVPSIEGVSHAPGEATAEEDLVRGAAALAASLVALDRALSRQGSAR